MVDPGTLGNSLPFIELSSEHKTGFYAFGKNLGMYVNEVSSRR